MRLEEALQVRMNGVVFSADEYQTRFDFSAVATGLRVEHFWLGTARVAHTSCCSAPQDLRRKYFVPPTSQILLHDFDVGEDLA